MKKIIYNSKFIDIYYNEKKNYTNIFLLNNKNKEFLFLKIKKFFIFIFDKNIIYSKLKKNIKFIINKFNIFSQNLISGFFIEIITKGIGYNVYLKKNYLFFDMRQSHYIVIKIPPKIIIKRFKARLSVFGYNKCKINNFIYKLLSIQKIDAYKGKGVIFKTQKLKLKEGKKR